MKYSGSILGTVPLRYNVMLIEILCEQFQRNISREISGGERVPTHIMIPLNHRECRWAYGNIERYSPRNSTYSLIKKILIRTRMYFFGGNYFITEDGDCYPDFVSLNFFHHTSPSGHLSWLLPHQQSVLPFLQTIYRFDGHGYSNSVPSVDSFNGSTFIFSTLYFCSHSSPLRTPPLIQIPQTLDRQYSKLMRSLSAALGSLQLSGTPRSL